MNRPIVRIATAIAALMCATVARNALASSNDPATATGFEDSFAAVSLGTPSSTAPASGSSVYEMPGSSLGYIGWQPRRPPRSSYAQPPRSHTPSATQIHAGYFDPDNFSGRGFVLGFRGGPLIDDKLQIGLGLDWRYKSEQQSQIVSQTPLPGGGTAQTTRVLSRASSNLFPILAFMQVNLGNGGIMPYVGAGAGYEALFISADDYNTGQKFDATYGGFGWQTWAGAGMSLGQRSRIIAEAFWNKGNLGRDVNDAVTGEKFRESVSMDGIGARFGLAFGF